MQHSFLRKKNIPNKISWISQLFLLNANQIKWKANWSLWLNLMFFWIFFGNVCIFSHSEVQHFRYQQSGIKKPMMIQHHIISSASPLEFNNRSWQCLKIWLINVHLFSRETSETKFIPRKKYNRIRDSWF